MNESKKIFEQLQRLSTEERNPASMMIDAASVEEALVIINKEDARVPTAVGSQIPWIAQAVNRVVEALRAGGRLIYVGAGTSGRLGVLDAAECPPTFGTNPAMVVGVIAGGEKAMFRAQEGAEDREENGSRDMDELRVSANDVVCGIAASLRTPYVIGAIRRAKELGARTLYVTTNPRSRFQSSEFERLAGSVDVAICPEVGPEVIMGSTRMKSGTAQKLVLNMITTAAMIRLGKVFENMMIDLQLTNQKLQERAKRILMTITEISYEEAGETLARADGHVKTAIVMVKSGASKEEAIKRLRDADGFVRSAIETGNKTNREQKK